MSDGQSNIKIPGKQGAKGIDSAFDSDTQGMDFDCKETCPDQEAVDYVENVDHPSHYNIGNIEVGDFIEDQAHLGWCRQNAIKYICRSGAKGGETKEQSIQKAIYYLERELGMHRRETS